MRSSILLAVLLCGCPVGTLDLRLAGSDDDDVLNDDDVTDDDDAFDDDDDDIVLDDDDVSDDDDTAPPLPIDGVSWGLELGVGDVVTVKNGLRISPTLLVLQVHYWADMEAEVRACTQRVQATGFVQQGPGAVPEGCPMCSALFVLDPDTVEDVSDASDPEQCAPDSFDGWDFNVGLDMLTPLDAGGWGDALLMAFVDVDWQLDAGWSPSIYDGYDAATIIENLSQTNLGMVGSLLMLDRPGSMVRQVGLGGAAPPIADGAPWLGFYFVLRPAADPLPSAMLEGGFGGQGYWNVALGG